MVYLQVKLCDPCLSALRLCLRTKWRYINNIPILFLVPLFLHSTPVWPTHTHTHTHTDRHTYTQTQTTLRHRPHICTTSMRCGLKMEKGSLRCQRRKPVRQWFEGVLTQDFTDPMYKILGSAYPSIAVSFALELWWKTLCLGILSSDRAPPRTTADNIPRGKKPLSPQCYIDQVWSVYPQNHKLLS